GGAAFQRGDPGLQHRRRRIGDAGVDVAEGLQAEQTGGVVDIVENEGRGLVDRSRARAGRRIRLGASMDGQSVEAVLVTITHIAISLLPIELVALHSGTGLWHGPGCGVNRPWAGRYGLGLGIARSEAR